VTRTPLSRSKGQRSRSPGSFITRRGVNASGSWWEHTATLRSALCRRGRLGGARRFGPTEGREGGGILWRPPAYSLLKKKKNSIQYVNPVPFCCFMGRTRLYPIALGPHRDKIRHQPDGVNKVTSLYFFLTTVSHRQTALLTGRYFRFSEFVCRVSREKKG